MHEQSTARERYGEYLKTREWQQRRSAALDYADDRCQICYSDRGRMHVHHRTYERVRNERPSDLTVLCEHCHKLFHGKIVKRSTDALNKWRTAFHELQAEVPSGWGLKHRLREEAERFNVVRVRCNPEQIEDAELQRNTIWEDATIPEVVSVKRWLAAMESIGRS